MQTSQNSKTAEYMAFFRAMESLRPPRQRLISDPFAASFLRPGLRRAIRLAKISGLRWLIEKYADQRLPGARTSAIARTRLIDNAWTDAIRDGIGQIVILGAGSDSRAYRLPESGRAAVFEVDHPATHALKRERLTRMLADIPKNVRFAAIDFNREGLPDVLATNGVDAALPALFLWEGVTNYLTEEAVDAVLRYVGMCAPGSRIGVAVGAYGSARSGGEFLRRCADLARCGQARRHATDVVDMGLGGDDVGGGPGTDGVEHPLVMGRLVPQPGVHDHPTAVGYQHVGGRRSPRAVEKSVRR